VKDHQIPEVHGGIEELEDIALDVPLRVPIAGQEVA
jgi:hypothetical protein